MKKLVFLFCILGLSVVCYSQPNNYKITAPLGPSGSDLQTGESSVYISPNHPNLILAGFNTYTYTPFESRKLGVFISSDGGVNWAVNSNIVFNPYSQADPSVAINRNGKYFVSYLYGGTQFQLVSYSNNGSNWTTKYLTNYATDKNFLYIDNECTSPYLNRIYDIWTDYGNNLGTLNLKYTDDEGETWSDEIRVYPPVVISGGESEEEVTPDFHIGVNLVGDKDGILYCSWIRKPPSSNGPYEMAFYISSDGGNSWDYQSSNISGGSYKIYIATNNCGPSMCYNRFDGYNGSIYLVYSNYDGTSSEPQNEQNDNFVHFMKFDILSHSWSTSNVRINNSSNITQVYPWISCDEYSNTTACVYYNKVNSTNYAAYVSVTTNGGSNWSHNQVSSSTFTSFRNASYIATDYIGINVRRGYIVPVWAQSESGNIYSYTAPFYFLNSDFDIPNTALTQNTTYSAPNSIYNSGSLSNLNLTSYNLTLSAGNYIQLNPGFDVVASGSHTFSASIPYCTAPEGDNFVLKRSGISESITHTVGDKNKDKIAFFLKSFPNPFNPTTTIEYGIPNDGNFKIIIYDVLGREIKTLLNDFIKKGIYSVSFNNQGLNSGVYYCRIISNSYNKTIKLLNIK